jgi:hypothetical protein
MRLQLLLCCYVLDVQADTYRCLECRTRITDDRRAARATGAGIPYRQVAS